MEAFAKKKGKEGTRGAGQIMKENAATLVFYRNMIMGANAMYFATNTMTGHSYFTFDIIMFIISAISFIASFQMMRSMGQPADDTTPGLDLNMQGGLAEHLKVKISISLLDKKSRYLLFIAGFDYFDSWISGIVSVVDLVLAIVVVGTIEGIFNALDQCDCTLDLPTCS